MKYRFLIAAIALTLGATAFSQGPKSSAEEMLSAIDAVKMPAFDSTKGSDRTYVQQYLKDRDAAMAEKAKLILDLYNTYPNNPKVPDLMNTRWSVLASTARDKQGAEAGMAETSQAMKSSTSPELTKNASYWWSEFKINEVQPNSKEMLAAAYKFTDKYKDDPRGFSMLNEIGYDLQGEAERRELFTTMLKNYPKARGINYISGKLRQLDTIGKPFPLDFTDVFSGVKHSTADFKGKVLVVDFWATWCGPCVAELPKMKEIYSKYHKQGVEFVSVSLDLPRSDDPTKDGLAKLKAFVAKNDMPWFHYYQGNYWSSEYSSSWGVNAIPCVFLVDQKGDLVDTEAREGLEQKIQKLLANTTK